MAERVQLMIKKGGVIPLTRKLLKILGAGDGDRFDVIFVDDGYLFLARAGERGINVSLSGDLQYTNIADVFSMLSMSQRTGVLILLTDGKKKNIYFKNGEIIYASSNEKEFLLGQILYKIGFLSDEQLEEAEKSIETSGERFGAILIKKGFLTPKQLWAGVKYQLEEIVYSAFELTHGHFVFIEGAEPPQDVVKFSLNTQSLLMEGFRRLDEGNVIKQAIPSLKARLRINPDKTPSGLSESLLKVYQVIEDGLLVEDVIRRTRMGEFNTLKLLHHLVNLGFVFVEGAVPPEKRPEAADLRMMVLRYNTLFTKIITCLREHNVNIRFKEQIADFLEGVTERVRELFRDVECDDTGFFDPDALLENAQRLYITDNVRFLDMPEFNMLLLKQHLQEGLNEILSFLLVAARSYLTEEDYENLLKETDEIRSELERT